MKLKEHRVLLGIPLSIMLAGIGACQNRPLSNWDGESLTEMEFLVGKPLTASERSVVLAEARDQLHKAGPALAAKFEKQNAQFVASLAKMSELQKAQVRERVLQYIVYGTNRQYDSHRSDAIILAHHPILARADASKTVLTTDAVQGILSQVDQMAIYQGRQPLSGNTKAQFAATLPASFQSAGALDQQKMAQGASRALQLRTALASFSKSSRASYQETAGSGTATPQMLQIAASKTLDQVAANRPGSMDALLKDHQGVMNLEMYYGTSYLIPHQ